MPVSGRPMKAALLKMTHGSAEAEVKGLQNLARGPDATCAGASEAAAAAGVRVDSKLPSTTNETIRHTSRVTMATRQEAGTVGGTTLGGDGSRGGTDWS